MANVATKAAKKAAKKTTRKVAKSGVNYAKGYVTKAIICWALAAGIGLLNANGLRLPSWLTGADTIAMAAFVIAGFVCYGRKLSVGRVIALLRTFMK